MEKVLGKSRPISAQEAAEKGSQKGRGTRVPRGPRRSRFLERSEGSAGVPPIQTVQHPESFVPNGFRRPKPRAPFFRARPSKVNPSETLKPPGLNPLRLKVNLESPVSPWEYPGNKWPRGTIPLVPRHSWSPIKTRKSLWANPLNPPLHKFPLENTG